MLSSIAEYISTHTMQLLGQIATHTGISLFALLVAAALNREGAEPVHLRDILEDLLADPMAREMLLQSHD